MAPDAPATFTDENISTLLTRMCSPRHASAETLTLALVNLRLASLRVASPCASHFSDYLSTEPVDF